MSAATIAEPFLLSSYPESAAHRKRKATPAYASLPSGSRADPFVTVAVQGDGVHVLDTSTLHPAVSHTLGPATYFSCPPATRTSQKSGVRTCTSYAVLESGPDVQPDGKGKTVVAWEEPLSGSMSTNSQNVKGKRVALLPHPAAYVFAPEYTEDRVVFVSASGEVTLADEDLRILQTFTPQNAQPSVLVKHFLFSSTSCSFLPLQSASSYGAISVSFLKSGNVLRLCAVGVDRENISSLGDCVAPLEETEILDISCSNAGFISVLLSSGTWHALSLSISPTSSLTISAAADPLRLQALTFTNATRTSEISLSALTSSHILLAAVATTSVPEIVLLLWDLRYGVLLAQQTISVPSTLPRSKRCSAVLQLQASTIPTAASSASKAGTVNLNALLVLYPAPERETHADGASTPARSTILVVPLSVPATSTIAAAMGKAGAGARWVSLKNGPNVQGQNIRSGLEMSMAARKALKEMKAAIDGSANASTAGAETVFFEYVKQQSKGKGAAAGGENGEIPLEYSFVQGVLELVLRAPTSLGKSQATAVYSSKIVMQLLETRMVSSTMVEGGLLPALAAQNAWDAIALAMRTVTDLPENDVTAVLAQVVAAHRRPTDDTAMQVDSSSPAATPSPPALPTFLAQCVTYPYTPAQQRTALRKHIPDASDLTALLSTLSTWLAQHTTDDVALLSHPDADPTAVSEGGAGVVGTAPPLEKVLAFLQTLLDASFLALLAHAPAHRLLRTLAAHVEPALARASELEGLCGPLEPFARKARAQAEAKESAKEGAKPDSGKDWRRKKKLAHEQAGMTVGLYQLEELVL